MLAPTVVKPGLRVHNVREGKKTRVCNHCGEVITLNNSTLISGQFEVLVTWVVRYNYTVLFVISYDSWECWYVGEF
jgi:hypothetical protein